MGYDPLETEGYDPKTSRTLDTTADLSLSGWGGCPTDEGVGGVTRRIWKWDRCTLRGTDVRGVVGYFTRVNQ